MLPSSSRQSRHSFLKYCERLAYCPSRNRTCGFPAYSSSNQHRFPSPDILRQVRFLDVVVPHPEKFVILEFPLLISSIQHPVGCIFHVLPEVLNRVKVPVDSVITVVSRQRLVDELHCFCHRLRQPGRKPRLDCLFLLAELLLAGLNPGPVFTAAGFRVVERESQKGEVLLCALEPPKRKYSRLVRSELQSIAPQPISQSLHDQAGLILVLKQEEEVVSISDVVYFSPELGLQTNLIPQIEYVMQVHVCKYW